MRKDFCEPVKDRRQFLKCEGVTHNVRVENCRPEPKMNSGSLLLSFDDRNFVDWENAVPLFEKYGAHATFFISGSIDATAVLTGIVESSMARMRFLKTPQILLGMLMLATLGALMFVMF